MKTRSSERKRCSLSPKRSPKKSPKRDTKDPPKTRRSTAKNSLSQTPSKKETKTRGGTVDSAKVSATKKETKAPRKSKVPDELDEVFASLDKNEEERKKFSTKHLQDLKKLFKKTVDTVKRETQIIDQENASKKVVGTTRSGTIRGHKKQPTYTLGKYVIDGIDASREKFDEQELQYLKKNIVKFKNVNELKLEYLKYLTIDVFLDDLMAIKEGKLNSIFHDRYVELEGKSKMDLYAEVKTSLFTNEQRDYLFGLLQGAFGTDEKDQNGDIKHSDMSYINIVMLAEIIIRIVKFVHNFETNEEARDFTIKKSREAFGIADDDDDDDD